MERTLPQLKVHREDQQIVEGLTLDERVAIERSAWDGWARSVGSRGFDPRLTGELANTTTVASELQRTFPEPASVWLATGITSRRVSHVWEFGYLAPMTDKVVLQLSGSGDEAVRFVLAGAAKAYCVDPSPETLRLGRQRAEHYGVSSRIEFVEGIAERLPFPHEFFDAVYGNAVIHHTLPDLAARDIYRVLKVGGRASFHDPLEGFALSRLARKYLPYPGRGDEGVDYPLTYPVIRAFISVFDGGEYRESELFGVPVEIVRRISPFGRRLEIATKPLDELLVGRFAFLRKYCKAVAIRVTKTRRR